MNRKGDHSHVAAASDISHQLVPKVDYRDPIAIPPKPRSSVPRIGLPATKRGKFVRALRWLFG